MDWIRTTDRLPENNQSVLVVKQLKNGQPSIGFGSYNADFINWKGELDPQWVTSGGCQNVVYWMPVPEVPEMPGKE